MLQKKLFDTKNCPVEIDANELALIAGGLVVSPVDPGVMPEGAPCDRCPPPPPK